MADEISAASVKKGERPDFRIVQEATDREGKQFLKSVGGVWKNTSKAGKAFYNIKIGDLRLLMFENDKTRPAKAQ